MGWYEEWSKRKRDLLRVKNYCSIEEFKATTAGFGPVENVEELNAPLRGIGELWQIATGEKKGFYYPSVDHPNFAQLEDRLKALEVGNNHLEHFDCAVFSRGMAAITTVLEALGNNKNGLFIHGKVMYPQTKEVLADDGSGRNMVGSLPALEIDLSKAGNLEKALYELILDGNINVLGVIFEPAANPTLQYSNPREIALVCAKYKVPVIVDNTFLTPYLMQPFRMGADIVVHSLTKYLNGEGDLIGGVAIFPNESVLVKKIRNYRKVKGRTMSPYDAYRCAQRVGGIGKRMEAHCKNAAQLAQALRAIGGIKVNYPNFGDETRNGYAGGVLSFVFPGKETEALERSKQFTDFLGKGQDAQGQYKPLAKVKQAVSFAEKGTLVLPWGGQVPDLDYLRKNNIPPGLVRIGVGREEDISPVCEEITTLVKRCL